MEKHQMDPSGFVLLADYIPQIVQEIRYYSTYNFIGDRIDGYEEPCALLTKEAARALKAVSNEMMVQGYRLKVFDAYRPACAVKHFVLWGIEDQDIRMKPYFYPDLEKQEVFAKGYIAKQSSHSRGSAIDLTLLDMKTGKEVDMGSPFDLFDEVSHPDFRASIMFFLTMLDLFFRKANPSQHLPTKKAPLKQVYQHLNECEPLLK